MTSWDDGKHTSVRKVRIEYGTAGISSIKVDYNKNGSLFAAPKHGVDGEKNDEFTLSSGEYLTEVKGYYTPTGSGDVITALTFQSNIRPYGPYGHTTRYYFSIDAPTNNQIVGFSGTSSNLLNDIDAQYGPIVSGGTDENNVTDPKPSDDSQKQGAEGSNGGDAWDDGAHDNVRKIYVGLGDLAVQYVKFEYEKGGKIMLGQDHGQNPMIPPPEEIKLDSDEYITSVEGTYESIAGYNDPVIVSLQFTTNKRTTEPYGIVTKSGTSFTLGDKVSKIIGFHGRSSDVLYKLGVYIKSSGGDSGKDPKPIPISPTLEAGSNGGNAWDDGTHDNVKKIYVGLGDLAIQYVKFEYEKGGKVVLGQDHGQNPMIPPPEEIKLDSDEYITSVEGTFEGIAGYNDPVIVSLQFTTNKRTTEPYGIVTKSGTSFTLGDKVSKIIGFHGRSSDVLYKLGVYIKSSGGDSGKDPKPIPISPTLEAGSNGGNAWDDGTHDNVKKIYVGLGDLAVQYVKFEYEKGGKVVLGQDHGQNPVIPPPEEIKLDSDEYVISVEGTFEGIAGYNDPVIVSLQFTTNKRTTEPYGIVTKSGTSFTLGDKVSKIIGFHGRSSDVLYKLGVYIKSSGGDSGKDPKPIPISPTLEAGSNGGNAWDDGTHDNVKKIYVGLGDLAVQYVKFEYEKGGKVVLGQDHGQNPMIPSPEEIKLDSDEYITSVEGTFEGIAGYNDPVIVSLQFTTNKRTTEPYGIVTKSGTSFTLGDKVSKIIGFHGRSSDVLYKLGVYLNSTGGKNPPPTPLSQKLDAQGGDAGDAWDDGAYDNVTRIHIGDGAEGIHYIKFEYDNGGQLVVGQEHGEQDLPPVEIPLNSDEYVISVEGFHDTSYSSGGLVIQSLKFKTNQKTTQAYGYETGTAFSLEAKDSKIIGFHGRSSKVIHKIGAYAKPISS